MPYWAEPYARAVLPTVIGPVTVDGKVRRYDDRILILDREDVRELVLNLWLPVALTRLIKLGLTPFRGHRVMRLLPLGS